MEILLLLKVFTRFQRTRGGSTTNSICKAKNKTRLKVSKYVRECFGKNRLEGTKKYIVDEYGKMVKIGHNELKISKSGQKWTIMWT